MGLIQLPSLDDIVQEKDPRKQNEMLIETLGILMKNLTELNGYMNSKNIKDLTADKISAGTINTGDITIGADASGRFYRIDGDGIVANNGSVNTLLFDLATGLLTLTSALIQSQMGYPKVELNSANNIVAAYSAPGTYLGINPNGTGSVPAIMLVALNTVVGFLNRAAAGGTTLGTFGSENLNLQASGNLVAQALGGNINLAPAGNLQIGGVNGLNGTFYVATTPGGSPTQPITFTKGIRTG